MLRVFGWHALNPAAYSESGFFLGQAIFASTGIHVHLGAPGTVRPVASAALYLAVFGLLPP